MRKVVIQMLEYCVCTMCERMIMLDSDLESGFCCYCGTHILYSEAREGLLEGLKASVSAEMFFPEDVTELIEEEEEDFLPEETYGYTECREECERGAELLGKWDFVEAFKAFSRALDWLPEDFESRCGLMVSGILRMRDTENWEHYLSECTDKIRSQEHWNTVGMGLEYALNVIKKFLSKGGRYVSPTYTVGFFEKVANKFPTLQQTAAEILAHCMNIEYAPYTDAARLDHETSRFAVGNCPTEPDKAMRRGMLVVIRSHCDPSVKERLCRALYVYDRAVWLRLKDTAHIEDALALCDEITNGRYKPSDVKLVLMSIYDFLMMGQLEQNSTEHEKILFLSTVYTYAQVRRMERFFGSQVFFNRLYGEVYLKQKGATLISPEYKRIQAKIAQLSG